MATIFARRNKDGSVSHRVMFRRKGIKPFITCFASREEALKFVNDCEAAYCLSPDTFTWDHLRAKREREFGYNRRRS